MSIPMIRRRPSFDSLSGFEFDDYSIQQKIQSLQHEQTREAFKYLREKHLVSGEPCCLESLGRILSERGSSLIEHQETSISDHLHVYIDGVEFELDKPLFPKRKHNYISINIPSICVREQIKAEYTPESIAVFLEAVKQWIPEYLSIEEKVVAQEKQRQMACKMAYDLMKRTIEPILEDKGYYYYLLEPNQNNKARIRINSEEMISLDISVDLLENFLEKLVNIVESLPSLPQKLERKLPF